MFNLGVGMLALRHKIYILCLFLFSFQNFDDSISSLLDLLHFGFVKKQFLRSLKKNNTI